MEFSPRLVTPSSRSRDFGAGVKRFIVSALGGTWPTSYVAAASARDAEDFFRRLNGFQAGGLLQRVVVSVNELED
jgi:hypothetical protein